MNGKTNGRWITIKKAYLSSAIKCIEKAYEHLKNNNSKLALHQIGNALQIFKVLNGKETNGNSINKTTT